MLTIEKKSVRAGKFVDTKHVDTIIRNYKQERWAANSEKLGKEDSLSVWYSIEELEDFLQKAKDHGADGCRMFFGVYGQDYEVAEYRGRQTMVMVATKQRTTAEGIENKNVYTQTNNGTSILAYNRGTICPPYCGKPGQESDFDELGITIVERKDGGLAIV